MPAPQMTSPTPEASQERRTLRARVAAPFVRAAGALRANLLLTLVLVCGLSVMGVSGALIAYRVWSGPVIPFTAEQLVAHVLQALESGQQAQASQAVTQLRQATHRDAARQGYLPFVLGVAVAQEAGRLEHASQGTTLYLIAARYLQEASDCGVPPGHERQARELLATCLFRSGRYGESLPALRAAYKAGGPRRYEFARELATAYQNDSPPNLTEALRYERVAAEDPALVPRERDEARLRQCHILLQLEDLAGCRETLENVAADTPVGDQLRILQARLLIEEASQLAAHPATDSDAAQEAATSKYRQAQEILSATPAEDLAGVTSIQAKYLLGVCQYHLGDVAAALASFAHLQRQHRGTDEAMAAALEEGEIHQAQNRPDLALSLYLHVVEQAASASSHDNPWMPATELRGRLYGAQHRFRTAQQHAAAHTLCTAFRQIFPPAEMAEIEAQTYEAWGESLARTVAESTRLSDAATHAEGRRYLRSAADAYRRLASLRYATSEYPTDLWKSGECFLRGQNYEAALKMLDQFLQIAPRKQHPQGLVAIGECHLALGRYHQSLDALQRCIQLDPLHPASYPARVLAAAACVQLKKTDEAKQLLIDNLHNSELSPRSLQWQRSLFAYGDLLFKEAAALEAESRAQGIDSPEVHARQQGLDYLYRAHGLYLEAIKHLEEAVQRYPTGRSTDAAWYAIAESYRHAARLPSRSLPLEAEADRPALLRQKRTYLTAAAAAYRQLQARLLQAQEQAPLGDVDEAMLRNTFFAYADTLFDLEDYEQAIPAYLAAANRYQQEPAALEALVQLASCYRILNAPAEAQGTLLQAQAALARLPADLPDEEFTRTTRYNRKEWTEMLGWLAQL